MNWISPRIWIEDTGTFGKKPAARAKATRVCRHAKGAECPIQTTRPEVRFPRVSAESVLWSSLWATSWVAIAISVFQLL